MVFPLAPWPARANGISIRYYPLLEAIAALYEIDVFVHGELRGEVPRDSLVNDLRRVAVEKNLTHSPALTDRLATMSEAVSPFGCPYQFARYHSEQILSRLRTFITGRQYDSVLWVTSDRRRLLDRVQPLLGEARILYDSIDSPYLHYSREPRPKGVMGVWRAFDLWKTRRWERGLVEHVDGAAYISAADAMAAAKGKGGRADVIPNGIYLAGEQVQTEVGPSGMAIGFLGNMGYPQNIKAAIRLHERIFRPLKAEFADLRLVIIGRTPSPVVTALASSDVEVTGTVESIWPYIAGVRAFVYPMVGGAGLQNKVLEAMHAGKPVVTTDICLQSIGAREGHEILIGQTDDELRAHVRKLLINPEYAREIGLRGKAYVDRTFDISGVLERFRQFLIPGE